MTKQWRVTDNLSGYDLEKILNEYESDGYMIHDILCAATKYSTKFTIVAYKNYNPCKI